MDDYSSDNQSDDGVVPDIWCYSVGEVVELPEQWFPTRNRVGSLHPWDVMLVLAHCHQMVRVKNFGRPEFERLVNLGLYQFKSVLLDISYDGKIRDSLKSMGSKFKKKVNLELFEANVQFA